MSFLSLVEAKMSPGFRFHPKDEELVLDYLVKKMAGNGSYNSSQYPIIIEVDFNRIEPCDLPEMACVGGKEWYFFSLRDRKYATGPCTNRATLSGYWKATGKDHRVTDVPKGTLVWMRKTLVFHQGRAPKGIKTDWVMHKFRLEGPHHSSNMLSKIGFYVGSSPRREECRCHPNFVKRTRYRCSRFFTPIFDGYFPALDQTPPSLEEFVQVPCFSDFNRSQESQATNPTLSPLALSHLEPNRPSTQILAQTSDPTDLPPFYDPISYEKEVTVAALEHFNELESNWRMLELLASPSLAEGSYDCYFPEMGLPQFPTVSNEDCFDEVLDVERIFDFSTKAL